MGGQTDGWTDRQTDRVLIVRHEHIVLRLASVNSTRPPSMLETWEVQTGAERGRRGRAAGEVCEHGFCVVSCVVEAGWLVVWRWNSLFLGENYSSFPKDFC